MARIDRLGPEVKEDLTGGRGHRAYLSPLYLGTERPGRQHS